MSEMADILKELKEILPEENISTQPDSAMETIREYEKKYQLNTQEITTKNYQQITEEDLEDWLRQYQLYREFNGKDNWINTIRREEEDGYDSNGNCRAEV